MDRATEVKIIATFFRRMPLLSTSVVYAFASPAFADRHCFPALDSYFAARQNIISTAENDTGALLLATENIAAALKEADICGCEVLKRRLSELVDILSNTNTTHESLRQKVLGGEATISAALKRCHH